jgi:hypothetical protein
MLAAVVAYRRAIEDRVAPEATTWMTVAGAGGIDVDGPGVAALDGQAVPGGAVDGARLAGGAMELPGGGSEVDGLGMVPGAVGLAGGPGAHAASARTSVPVTARWPRILDRADLILIARV